MSPSRSLDDVVDGREYFKVEVPDDYYQKELDAYRNWQFAWGREIGQNSLDAGSKNIIIKVEAADSVRPNEDSEWRDSTCWVDWTDDGCGMDIDDGEGGIVVFSKFLVLGASKKKKGDTGGFGWAKKLICFAMIEWHIRTGSLHIHGKGGTYWVERNLDHHPGTHMRIRVPASKWRIEVDIGHWLYWTDVGDCEILLNDEPVQTFADIKVKGTRNIPGVDWARLTVTDEPGNDIIIRANGQMMSKMAGSDDQQTAVVIEVIGKSKDYFTSNRDSLRSKAMREISSFLNSLFKNPRRISKTEVPITTTYGGNAGAIKIGDCHLDGPSLSDLLACGMDIVELLKMMCNGTDDSRVSGDREGFDIHIHNEMEGHEIPARFIPGTWSEDNIELMAKWCAIIKFIGEVVGYNGSITPGWAFSPDVAALHKRGHILLNPISINSETWDVSDRFTNSNPVSDWNTLVEHAIHEFTHALGFRYHNVEFICNMGRCFSMVLDNAEELQILRDSFYSR